jgi:tetraacyldisaccharide 4'-kinase
MGMLPDAETFKRLVDGTTTGPAAAAARAALAAIAVPYGLAVAARNAAYDRGLLPATRVAVPVISVGNLTLGGTGKTPLVAWVVRQLLSQGRTPAVVSRGYAARPGQESDEAAELAMVIPGLRHVANRDRVAGSQTAIAAGCDTIVLDDGFQHRRLHRDLDLVAIDATDPFGCGRLFPRGLLREPLGGLARARAVVLTRASSVSATRRGEIRGSLAAWCAGRPPAVWMEAEHRPIGLRTLDGSRTPIDALRGMPVVAFAGIGNPAAFRTTLEKLGADVVAFQAFPDHHTPTAADLAPLAARIEAGPARMLVTTLKDLVKVPRPWPDATPLAAVEIAIEPLTGGPDLASLLAAVASHRDASSP